MKAGQDYFIDNGDAGALQLYRQRRAQKREPVVVITKDRKIFLVALDMTSTGARLNSLGQRVYTLLAARLGNPNATISAPIRVYSLSTAQKAARELATLGKQLQNRQAMPTEACPPHATASTRA